MSITDENLKLNDLKIVSFKDGSKKFKAIVYSSLKEQCVSVYIPQSLYEELITLGWNVDANNYFCWNYNTFKNEFVITYKT